MKVSTSKPETHFHIRSISLPTKSHPISSALHKEVEQLEHLMASSSGARSDICSASICGLAKAYECVQALMQLPQVQQSASNSKSKCVEEMQDASMRLVDLCGTARDMLLHMKESLRDLQSSLRTFKFGDLSDMKRKVKTYLCSKKKMEKQIKKCIGDIKSIGCNLECSYQLSDDNYNLDALFNELREVRLITISVFELFLSWIAGRQQKSKANKWSLIAIMVHKKPFQSGENENQCLSNEMEHVDQAISSLSMCLPKSVEDAKSKFKDLECCIETLETGFEVLFRQFICTRVSLLNILVQ